MASAKPQDVDVIPITRRWKKRKASHIEKASPSANKGSPAVFGDKKMVPRVKELVFSHDVYPEAFCLMEELQKRFPEYRRRQRASLKVAVNKALSFISSEMSDDESFECDLPTEAVVTAPAESIPQNEKVVDNSVNTSLSNLYTSRSETSVKKKKKRRTVTEEENENEATKEIDKVLAKQLEMQQKYMIKPSISFDDLGGIDQIVAKVKRLLFHIEHPELFDSLGIEAPRGFLLHGPPGVGKTVLVEAITSYLNIPCLKCGSTELITGISGESEGKIRELFTLAKSIQPSIVFIDEIDAITPKRDLASREMEKRVVTQLLTSLDELGNDAKVLVIGATSRLDAIDPGLRRAGRFDREISIGIPDEESRRSILRVLCRTTKLSSDFDYEMLAHKTPGFVAADLKCLIREAAIFSLERVLDAKLSDLKDVGVTEELLASLAIEMQDFDAALKVVQPSSKREGFATIPDVTWDQVGALKAVREELQMSILAPVRYRQEMISLGLTASVGVLLCGPPGCGKTLLAKAIANESGINFLSVKGPELLNMYVGESERAIRSVFTRAANSKPCVVFFDEIDALCPRRTDSESSNVTSRIVNQLLTEMDGLETRSCFLLAATNRPDILDPAVLRPGRFDKVVYVGLPDDADRLDILKTITKNGTQPPCDATVNLETIAKSPKLNGFTGADLNALVREASLFALKDKLNSGNSNRAIKVSMAHFENALLKVKPSVSKEEQIRYEKLKNKSISL